MARGTSKVLPDTTVDPIEAARLAAETAAIAACDTAIETIFKAGETAKAAQALADTEADTARGMREKMYIFLANAAHTGRFSTTMTDKALKAAINKWYFGNKPDAKWSATQYVMQTELARAMHPKVRSPGVIQKIMAPWIAAWEAETAALEADENADKPVRDKFHSRHQAVTQAIKLAIGEESVPAKGKRAAKAAVPSVTYDKPAEVLGWISDNKRVARAPSPGSNNTPPAPPVELSARKKAEWRVEQLVTATKAVAADFPHTDCFKAVLAAFALCTGVKLVPNVDDAATPAPAPAPAPAPEPVAGVSNLVDDAMSDDDVAAMAEFKAYRAFLAMRNAAK